MIIKNITVREFGPLEGFSADLAPGVNLIEGANESGKSSLIGFIRFILYGLPARRGDGIAERDRALSWKGSAADGSMTVEYDGGGYRIERRAVLNGTRDNCVDRVRIIDLATGTEVHKGEAPGKVFLGVPQNVFDSTACIRQLDIGGLDGAGIGAAIENMLFSADAALNVKNATTRLTNARRALRNQRMQNGELDILERRRDELTARLSRAEESAKNISEARAQAEKCRTLAAEVRRSLNSNEDRLTAYGGLQTLHRFDMLHAGERKIAALRAQRDSLESAGGFGGYLPDREYAPALDAARRRLAAAEEGRLDAYESAERMRAGRIEHEELADIGDAAERRHGADFAEKLANEYSRYISSAHGLTVSGAVLLGAGIIAAACGAGIFFAGYAVFSAVAAALGLAAAVAGAVCLAAGGKKRRRASGLAAELGLPRNEKNAKEKRVSADEFAARAENCADAAAERRELRGIVEHLDAELAQKTSASDAALGEAVRLLGMGGVSTDGCDTDGVIRLLEETAGRARRFCDEREAIERDIEKYEASVAETVAALAGEDEVALRARIAPVEKALAGQNLSDIKKARDYDRARLEKIEEKRVELEKRLAALEATVESPARLYPEWESVCAEAEKLSRKLDAVMLASEAIDGASKSLRLGITPRLRRDAGEIMSALTDGKYTEFGIGADMSVSIGTQSGTRPVAALSTGTRDAAYFALRTALTGLLFPRSAPPVILDESLAMMDDARARRMLDTLSRRFGETGQCLIFSCQRRERAMLDAAGVKYNRIVL